MPDRDEMFRQKMVEERNKKALEDLLRNHPDARIIPKFENYQSFGKK